MKKTLTILSAGLLMAGVSQAATVIVDLSLAASGTYTNASATVVSTSVTIGTTGSFDIEYTLGSNGGTNPFVSATGTQYGVGSDTDIAAHYNTAEGNDGEGLSFTGLTINNFVAGDSGLTESDITDLTFTSLSLNNVANNNDGMNVSFTSFADAGAVNQNLNAGNTGGTPYTHDLTAQGNYTAPETDLFVEVDSGQSNNRWAITGLEVSFEDSLPIPEPSSTALIGLGGLVFILRRRK